MLHLDAIFTYIVSYDLVGQHRGSDRRRFLKLLRDEYHAEPVLQSQYMIESFLTASELVVELRKCRYVRPEDRLLVNVMDVGNPDRAHYRNLMNDPAG